MGTRMGHALGKNEKKKNPSKQQVFGEKKKCFIEGENQ